MVVRIASIGTEVLDLNNPADEFGLGNDIVVINNSYGTPGTVATYAGNDVIVLNDLSNAFSSPVFGGTGNDRITGGAGVDAVNGGDGNDLVFGAGGNDEIAADAGNDYYDGGAGSDIIHFSVIGANGPGGGVANASGVRCDLAVSGPQDLGVFGLDELHGIENIFGSAGNDQFFGTNGANGIEGRSGDDLVDGRGGNDTLFAFDGSDTMIGGLGADAIILHEPGGAARDTVRYFSLQESGTSAASRDRISNFDRGGQASDDKIDLSAIDARPNVAGNQAFSFVGQLTAAAGEVQVTVSGSDTLVIVDTDADASAEMSILVAGVTGLTAADFIL
jgi:Ca2+-binding RTX toxin-like protein